MDRGKSLDNIRNAVGLSSSGEVRPELFAGSKDKEDAMLKSFNSYHKSIYKQAQADHTKNAKLLGKILSNYKG
jgi:hypothetical protein